jgi:peptidyl-tRNA hydrolase, PTH1 family
MEGKGDYLIVGLGNPGAQYEKTRHNLGFLVVEALAKKQGLIFKKGWRLNSRVASGVIGENKVTLLMPSTYMNLSGTAVGKAVRYYKIALTHVIIVVDEAYLKLGTLRIRAQGSAGGHNGLKSIEACLGTQEYPRLRMGVGPQEGTLPNGLTQSLEEYVLAHFTADEEKLLPQVVEKGVQVIEHWLSHGVEAASQLAGELSK